MSIKSVAKLYDTMKGQDVEYAMTEEGGKESTELFHEFTENADNAQKIITDSVSESDFVKYMTMAENAAITAMVMNGEFDALNLKKSGLLRDYTHTVVLAIIGGLIRDEVL
jgi:hypothetical protein